jgi:hypothetical protein
MLLLDEYLRGTMLNREKIGGNQASTIIWSVVSDLENRGRGIFSKMGDITLEEKK